MKALTLLFLLLLNSEIVVSSPLKVLEQRQLSKNFELKLHSEILKKDLRLHISLPEFFEDYGSKVTFPVIFINDLHGERFFGLTSEIYHHLGGMERLPQSIIVSLNGGGSYPEVYHNGMWGEQQSKKFEKWGDAKLFLQFFETELMPFLMQSYRANEHATIIGVSGSAFFPIWALHQKNDLFDTYIIHAAADVLGMGFDSKSAFYDSIPEALASNLDSEIVVHFSVGDNDLIKDERYQNNFKQLQQNLYSQNPKGVSAKFVEFENEGHYDSYIKALLSAIEHEYPYQTWSIAYKDIVSQQGNALENLALATKKLSESASFDIFPRAKRWRSINRLGYLSQRLMREGRNQEAIEIAEQYLIYMPNDPQGYKLYGETWLSIGNVNEALIAFKKALSFAGNNERLKAEILEKITHIETKAPR